MSLYDFNTFNFGVVSFLKKGPPSRKYQYSYIFGKSVGVFEQKHALFVASQTLITSQAGYQTKQGINGLGPIFSTPVHEVSMGQKKVSFYRELECPLFRGST